MARRLALANVLLCMAALIGACGQKGPLYLPDSPSTLSAPAPASPPPAAEPEEEEDDDEETAEPPPDNP